MDDEIVMDCEVQLEINININKLYVLSFIVFLALPLQNTLPRSLLDLSVPNQFVFQASLGDL